MIPQNRTLFTGDNLEIMREIDSACIDLIYLDPPFCTGRDFGEFDDRWNLKIDNPIAQLAYETHSEQMAGYISFIYPRLIEMKRILKPTGSIYYHCDQTASHYIKIIMDSIFGEKNFRNEIIWAYKTGGTSKSFYSKKHDIIFFYSKTKNYIFHKQEEKSYTKARNRKAGIINYGKGKAEFFEDEKGVFNYTGMRDVWEISYIGSTSKERTGYPTQKPKALLERIIKGSSNPGDLILDPFAGCATTCIAAENINRKWIGIDISETAANVIKQRFKRDFSQSTIFTEEYFGEVNHIQK